MPEVRCGRPRLRVAGSRVCARGSNRHCDPKPRRARELCGQCNPHFGKRGRTGWRNALRRALESRSGDDDSARKRAGITDRVALTRTDWRRRLRRSARPRRRHPDSSRRQLQRQRIVRGEHRKGSRCRGPARAGQRPLRIERRARNHQCDSSDAGRDSGIRRRARGRQRPVPAPWDRRIQRHRDRRNRARHAWDGRRRLARFVRVRGRENECRVGATFRGWRVDCSALRFEPRPADRGIHHWAGRVPRPRARTVESGPGSLSRRDEPSIRIAIPGKIRQRTTLLSSQFPHGLPPALPARTAHRRKWPGQRRLHVHDDGPGDCRR